MAKHIPINRAYVAGDVEKTPEEKQKELDELMKQFLAKGGRIEKLTPGSAYNVGSMEKSGKPHWTDREIKNAAKKKDQ